MPEDNNDDVLEINLDDDEDEPLDITLEEAPEETAPSDAVAPEPADEQAVTEADAATRYCPVCGFALPPLADECPRCARSAASAPAEEPEPERPQQDYPAATPSRSRRSIGLIIGLVVVVALIVVVPLALFNSPTFKARAAYQDALKAQLAGDLQTAQDKYRQALEYNPEMGLAAFGLGTTHLGITLGAGDTSRRVTELLQQAEAGNTAGLDRADRWFDRAIDLANRMPDDRKLIDQNLRTPRKLASYGHAFKSLTALIRYYAAIQADNLTVAQQWLHRVNEEAGQALALDPDNPFAAQIRGQVGL